MNPIKHLINVVSTPYRDVKNTLRKQHHTWQPLIQSIKKYIHNPTPPNQSERVQQLPEDILERWSIEPDQKQQVMKNLNYEKWLYCVLASIPMISAFLSPHDAIMNILMLIIAPGLFIVALTREWRLFCLKQSQFTPFKTWVKRGCQ